MASKYPLSSSELSQERSKKTLTTLEKLMILPNVFRTLLKTFSSIFSSYLQGKDNKPPSVYRYAMYTFVRTITALQSPSQLHAVSPSTDKAYRLVCKRYKVEPNTIILEDGTTAHWIGSAKAKKVLINFHGGGYVLPASEFMVDFMFKVQEEMKSQGKDFAVLFLAYDLAPAAQYPRQLQQAAMLLQYVTTTLGRSPSDLFLSGDSAGGNLVLSLLSHISHPHPDQSIPRVELSAKLRGVILVSPWLDFKMDDAAWRSRKDLIGPATGKRWSKAWLGTDWPHTSNTENYNQANLAPASWWEDVKFEEALVVAGKDELLAPGIEEFTKKWQNDVKGLDGKVSWLCAVGEAHDMPSLDLQFGYKEPGEQARMIKSWLAARL